MPAHFVSQCINFAHSANQQRQFATAVRWCNQALHLVPELPEAWYNLGIAYQGLGKKQEALHALERARAGTFTSADAQNSIGLQLVELGAYPQAEQCLNRSIELAPNFSYAHSNLGKLREKQGLIPEAEFSFRAAIQAQPSLAPAYVNLAGILNIQHRHDEAAEACRKAIDLDATIPEAWNNRGNALKELHRLDEALASYNKAFLLKPEIEFLFGAILHTRMRLCNWEGFAESVGRLITDVSQEKLVTYPFVLLGILDSPDLHRLAARTYANAEFKKWNAPGPVTNRSPDRKIRVGYFSPDFRNHAVSFLIAELFELHDRSRFEVYGFSFGPVANDDMHQRVSAAFDGFIDIRGMSDPAVASLSRELGIDIAVDLCGYTTDSRTGIFAERAAPIQVNYLGYIGTMGADFIDYVIADKIVIPPESQSHYTEKVAYLPHSYQVNDSKRKISDRQFTRQELGLPDEGCVFCCFNNNYKILPKTFDGWMRIMKAVEGSVLWLLEDNPTAAMNLRNEAERRGVGSKRLVFARRVPPEDYLARYRAADLMLDTFPYNAGTTASDALWAGLPVLTCMGKSFVSRMAASLLSAIHLPELIAHTQQEYEARAVELATHPDRLREVKDKLERNRLTTPLFDTKSFAKHIEAAYLAMYGRYEAGLPLDVIEVSCS